MTDRKDSILEVDLVSIQFGGLRALSDVSFEVNEGEILALIGPNGAGKTTLLNIASGALKPTSGSIRLDGETVSGLTADQVNRQGIVRTFQAAEIFGSLSLRQNVMVGGVAGSGVNFGDGLIGWGRARRIDRELHEKAEAHLALVGLLDDADRPAASLPAGQQRLLGIARALATDPKVMLLDEPGAGLNNTEKKHLVDVVRRLREDGKTIVLVEHDMQVIKQLADRIVVLDHGAVIGVGTPQEVQRNEAVVNAYLGSAGAIDRLPLKAGETSFRQLLDLKGINIRYNGVQAVNDVSLNVDKGEIVTIVGANGAGKSSILKAIAGVVTPAEGDIALDGASLAGRSADERVALGMSLTPEGRELFPSLSVHDNLILGRYARLKASKGLWGMVRMGADEKAAMARRLEFCFDLFPILAERRNQLAATLSGGQAQMLAIARSLMNDPTLLMLDEPSLGLAPQINEVIFRTMRDLQSEGLTILLIEQNARAALQIANRGYVLVNGSVVASGNAADLLADDQIASSYLGFGDQEDPEDSLMVNVQ
jgi:branched-chain amino acid transport system ATP-binding protein